MLGLGAYPHAAWNLYNLALASHPIFTKCMTSLTCFILSDTVAQLPSGKVPYLRTSTLSACLPQGFTQQRIRRAYSSAGFLTLVALQFDALRTARFAAFGFAVHAPTGHVWYNILDNYVYPSEPTRCAPGAFGLPCQVIAFNLGLASAKHALVTLDLA